MTNRKDLHEAIYTAARAMLRTAAHLDDLAGSFSYTGNEKVACDLGKEAKNLESAADELTKVNAAEISTAFEESNASVGRILTALIGVKP